MASAITRSKTRRSNGSKPVQKSCFTRCWNVHDKQSQSTRVRIRGYCAAARCKRCRREPLSLLLRCALHSGVSDVDRYSRLYPQDRQRQSEGRGCRYSFRESVRRRVHTCLPDGDSLRRKLRPQSRRRRSREDRCIAALCDRLGDGESRAFVQTRRRDLASGCDHWRGTGWIGVRSQTRFGRPSCCDFRCKRQARRLERIRYRRIQDSRRLRAARDRMAASRSKQACRWGAISRSMSCASNTMRCLSLLVWPGVRELALEGEALEGVMNGGRFQRANASGG